MRNGSCGCGLRRALAGDAESHCAICSSRKSIELHHLFYRKRWEDAELSDLRWLCDICHETIHELIRKGLTFPKPDNHNSCFQISKIAVEKARKINFYAPKKTKKPPPICLNELRWRAAMGKPKPTGSKELDRAIQKCDWKRVRQIEEKMRQHNASVDLKWPRQ